MEIIFSPCVERPHLSIATALAPHGALLSHARGCHGCILAMEHVVVYSIVIKHRQRILRDTQSNKIASRFILHSRITRFKFRSSIRPSSSNAEQLAWRALRRNNDSSLSSCTSPCFMHPSSNNPMLCLMCCGGDSHQSPCFCALPCRVWIVYLTRHLLGPL